MKRIYVEEVFDYKGYKCACTFVAGGWRCGYVLIDSTHPYYMKEHISKGPDEIMCHWGLTYSGDGKHFYDTEEELWCFGFDCGHFEDGIDYDTSKKYGLITDKEYLIQKEIVGTIYDGAIIKDKEFVKDNCKMIVEQLIIIKNKENNE